MNIEDFIEFTDIIDGNIMYVLNNKTIMEYYKNRDKSSDDDMLNKIATFLINHPQFSMALYKKYVKIAEWEWGCNPLVKYNDDYHVVSIQRITCMECGEQIRIINPTFDMVRNMEEDERIKLYEEVGYVLIKCPKCQASFRRYGVYA